MIRTASIALWTLAALAMCSGCDGGGDMTTPDGGTTPDSGAPPVTGACCLINTTCAEAETDVCATQGGTFTADRTCAMVTCPGPDMRAYRRVTRNFEAALREDVEWYLDTVAIVGREYWNLNGDDPGYTNELLGRQGASLDPTGEFTTRPFAASYRIVREADAFVQATQNAAFEVTEEEINAVMGVAKTFQAYALLLVLNHQFSNGILPLEALDEADPSGSFLDYTQSLQYIDDLLLEAATLLTNGGTSFIFPFDTGFDGFNSPATFRQFNRALSARVRLYQGDKSGALSSIAGSFFNINGDINRGPKHTYDGLERLNPMYHEPDEDLYTAHALFISQAEAGDLGVSSNTRAYVPTPTFFVPVTLEGLVGDRQLSLVNEDYEPLPILRNEELILIYGETQIGSDVNEVLAAINRVRNARGLGNYLGATDDASLLNQVIHRRRYGLYGEGHRWVDLRRTGKFGEIPVDRVGDIVHMEFPRPTNAVQLAVSGM